VLLRQPKQARLCLNLCRSERGNYQGFDIAFDPPVALQAGIQYSLEASITGPPSWYGDFGSDRVEHAGVTFFFTNKAGEVTSVHGGQFPELVFTVC